jgi:SAM-dependent methyltransferase
MNQQDHWNTIYRTKGARDVSWFEPLPAVSLELIEAAGLTRDTCVVDVGGGESRLVDALLARGSRCLAVLDLSGEALRHAQTRLGAAAQTVTWLEADVTSEWALAPMDIWHDRAVFHFLIDPAARARYVRHLRDTLKPQGSAIIATFALDGPERCSGLPVMRYSPVSLAAELGDGFTIVESRAHVHVTPWGATQSFQYSWFRCCP